MKGDSDLIVGADKVLYAISGIVLSLMVMLTFTDVIARNLGHPITGSMEIIQYGGCVVFSFSLPYGTLLGAQVIVDILVDRLRPNVRRKVLIVTKIIGVCLFLFIAYWFFTYGFDVKRSGERTSTFRIPYYPFAFVMAFSFFMQSLTIFRSLLNQLRGEKR